MAVSAKARSQTDARCYLALLLSRPVQVTVNGKVRSLRIVGGGPYFYQENHEETQRRFENAGDDNTWTHKITFWNEDHGITANSRVRVELPRQDMEDAVEILEGTATKIAEHEVYLSGSQSLSWPRDMEGRRTLWGS